VHPVGHPPRLGPGGLPRLAAHAKELAPQLHLHAYSAMEIAHMVDVSGLSPAEVFARLRDAGL
jgi:2-iminoacetate synthase ThiH